MTSETLDRVAEGQEELIRKQKVIKDSQVSMQSYLASNMRDLHKEKALIMSGHKQLAELTEGIKKKIG